METGDGQWRRESIVVVVSLSIKVGGGSVKVGKRRVRVVPVRGGRQSQWMSKEGRTCAIRCCERRWGGCGFLSSSPTLSPRASS